MTTKRGIEILGLTGIIQVITENKSSGILYTRSGNQEKYIYFRNGNVQMVASPNSPSILAEALRRSFQEVDDETLESIFQAQGETAQPLTTILQEMGAEEDFIIELCRFQIGEEIFETFVWPDVQFEFSDEEPPANLFRDDLIALPIEINPGMLLMEVARRLAEWENISETFPSKKDIPYIAKDIYEELSEEETHLLSLTDGANDFEEVFSECRLPMFQAMCIYQQMKENGYISLRTSSELKEMAEFEEFREDVMKCIKLYERAEELGEKDIGTISWLAEAYESSGLIGKAVTKYKELGDQCLAIEDLEGSIRAYARVITYAPEDLEAHDQYVIVLFQNGQYQEGAHAAIVYARKLAVEDKQKAIQILEDAYQRNPLSPEVLEYMATLHYELGMNVEAIFTYTNLANLYKSRGLFDETVAAYGKILELDNANIEGRIELAKTYLLMGNHEEGVAEYKRLGDILRQSGLITNTFGFEYLINVCEKIIEFEPTNLSAREWLADVYIYRQDYEKAKMVLLELLDFLQGGEKSEALVSVLQKLVQIEPENRDYHRMLAQTYHHLDRFLEATQELVCVGDLAIEEGTAILQSGDQQGSVDIFMESLQAFNDVLSMEPFNLDVRQKRAELLQKLGSVPEAVEEYKLICNMTKAVHNYHDALIALFHIVELAPDVEVSAFWELARICERQHKDDLAINFYKKYALRSLEQGDLGEVSLACRRVAALAPDDRDVEKWRNIAMTLK